MDSRQHETAFSGVPKLFIDRRQDWLLVTFGGGRMSPLSIYAYLRPFTPPPFTQNGIPNKDEFP